MVDYDFLYETYVFKPIAYIINHEYLNFLFHFLNHDLVGNWFSKKDYFLEKHPLNYFNFYESILLNKQLLTLQENPFFISLSANLFYIFIIYILFIIFIQNSLRNGFGLFNSLKFELDQNILNFEDTLLKVVFILLFFTYQFGFFFFSVNVVKFYYYIYIFILTYFILVFSVPLLLLIYQGIATIFYVKGDTKEANLILGFIHDFMSQVTFFLRFILQLIRLLLIFIVYFLLHEWFFSLDYDFILNYNQQNHNTNNNYLNLINYVLCLIRFIFELLDFLFIFFVQISALWIVIFWLFGFLFTTNLSIFFENFFSKNNN